MKNVKNTQEIQNVEDAISNEAQDVFVDAAQEETVSLENLFEEASIAARALSAAHQSDSVAAIEKAREGARIAIEAHNKAYFATLYKHYLDKEDPCREVVTDCYCRVLRLVESNTGDGVNVELDYATKVIDLRALDSAAKQRVITTKGSWQAYAEMLAFVLAYRATSDIGGDTKELQRLYKMSEHARGLVNEDKTRKADPISNRSLVAAVQEAVNAILFIDDGNKNNTLHITTKDVSFLLYTLFRRGRKELSVNMPRAATVISALTEVMYKLINGKCYSAEYDKIETKKEA